MFACVHRQMFGPLHWTYQRRGTPEDVRKLLLVLQGLVDKGNTVIVIEHNLDVVKSADWIIDLGPEGGDGGGTIVTEGTPEQVAQCEQSWTGKFLKGML